MRVAFFGTPHPAVPSLRALLADPDVEVACVVTNPDRPRGRGHKLAAPPVKQVAIEAGIDVWQPQRPRDIAADLGALGLDACAIVAYGSILPPTVLDQGGRGFVNLHFSLLPAWRGAAPVPAALLAGDVVVGVSCFVLEEGMDTGPVLATESTRVLEGENAGELTARLAALGAPVLLRALTGFVDGSLEPQAQDDGAATFAPKITPDKARIDWTADADVVDRAIRAYQPVPGAHTTFRGARLKVHRARRVAGSGAPGTVIGTDGPGGAQPGGARPDGAQPGGAQPDGGPVVACGIDAVCLDEVQPAGKARMSGIAFVNGYRPEGEQLGQAPTDDPGDRGDGPR